MKIEVGLSEQDLELIRTLIREELSRATPAPPEERFYTLEETCGLLKISKPTFHNWKKKQIIKCSKIQNRVLISEREVNRLLSK